MSGYDPNFIGVNLPIPTVDPSRHGDVLVNNQLTAGTLADYPNYAVVTDTRHRSPLYVVAHIDRSQMKQTNRSDNWQLDQRVGDHQLDNDYYRNNPWDRGHMARRESAGWGPTVRTAQVAADETFYYTNAVLQHENVNQDEWLALEDWVQDTAPAQGGRMTVFAGPVYGEFLRTVRPTGRPEGDIPTGFFKVVCFVNAQTGQLDVRAFYMLQDQETLRDKRGRLTFEFQHYQVTITEIERLTGLRFPDAVYDANPLFFHPNPAAPGATSFPERIDVDGPSDIVTDRNQPRVSIQDDASEVYIAAAMVDPPGVDDDAEWVSIVNLEDFPVDLAGWKIVEGPKPGAPKNEKVLGGVLQPGEAKTFRGKQGLAPVRLGNKGGFITLLNAQGERIDRADWSEREVKRARGKKNKPVPLIFFTYRLRE